MDQDGYNAKTARNAEFLIHLQKHIAQSLFKCNNLMKQGIHLRCIRRVHYFKNQDCSVSNCSPIFEWIRLETEKLQAKTGTKQCLWHFVKRCGVEISALYQVLV